MRDPRDDLRILLLVVVPVLLVAAACATPEPPAAPELEGLVGMREAADAAQAAWGVPADLTLAVAYSETRWRVPEEEEHEGAHEGHAPAAVGVGGLRPWLSNDPVATAERMLGLDRTVIGSDPAAGILATAAVLRDLAARRHGEMPSPDDVGAWLDIVGDYSGIEDAESRRGYAEDVYRWLERGIRTVAADGQVITLAPRTVVLPEGVEGRRAYAGSEYPGARFVAAHSSNYSSGRSGESVRYIIIHTMQGSYSGSISWFQNSAANASAHYNIRSSDGEITQMVREADTGWHAGNLTYNRRSIGIEHEGYISDPGRWYTDAMYRSSAALTRHLCDKYGIPIDRDHIFGHNEVPDPYDPGTFGGAGNHTDPGSGWDWARFMALVRGEPPRPDYDAQLVGQDHPTDMVSGDRAVAWVELRNEGARTWDLENTRVGTTGPRDHASPLFDAENWINDHRPSGADHSTYSTGSVGRFTFMVQAPEVTEETVITETFGLVQEGVGWFGPEDITFTITVRPAAGTAPSDPPADDPATDGDPDGSGTAGTPSSTTGSDTGAEPSPTDGATSHSRPETGAEMVAGGCSVGAGGSAPAGWALLLLGLVSVVRRRGR